MKRCVVVGGAAIEKYESVKEYFTDDDYFIFCDCGLRHAEKLGVSPDLIVGDFDSYDNPNSKTETIVLPRAKDDTDTVYAVKKGIERGFKSFLLVGALGQRLDHTMVNVYLLQMLDEQGIECMILDDYSEVSLVSGKTAYISDSFEYFSLVNITGTAKGVTIEHAVFPLKDGEITTSYQFATSNEVIKGKTASVTVKEGKLLLIKIRKDRPTQ